MQLNATLLRRLVIAGLLCLMTVLPVVAETGSVTVKKAAVKKSPRVFSSTVATLQYADRVKILDRANGWTRVELEGGRRGWLRDSDLNKPDLALRAGAQTVGVAASEEELTLAGKGFDSAVEKKYRQQNADVDYAWIDRMESYRPDDVALDRFLQQGGLMPHPGGAHAN